METDITPQTIEDRALEARVSLTDVLNRSGVSRGAFYNWRNGKNEMRQLTKLRLLDAVEAIAREAKHDLPH